MRCHRHNALQGSATHLQFAVLHVPGLILQAKGRQSRAPNLHQAAQRMQMVSCHSERPRAGCPRWPAPVAGLTCSAAPAAVVNPSRRKPAFYSPCAAIGARANRADCVSSSVEEPSRIGKLQGPLDRLKKPCCGSPRGAHSPPSASPPTSGRRDGPASAEPGLPAWLIWMVSDKLAGCTVD